MFKRLCLFLLGFIILNFGTSCIIVASIGVSPWDTVFIGVHYLTGLSIGTCVFIIQMILVFIVSWIRKKPPEWLAVIAIFVSSVALDLWLIYVFKDFQVEHFAMSLLFCVFGVLFQGLGIAIYLKSKFPKSQLDAIMLAFTERFDWSLKLSRTFCEGSAFLIGIAIGGPFGIGTILAIFLIGPFIQFFTNVFNKGMNQ